MGIFKKKIITIIIKKKKEIKKKNNITRKLSIKIFKKKIYLNKK